MLNAMSPNLAIADASHTDSESIVPGVGVAADVSRYVVVEINASFYGFITDATVELMSGSSIPVTRVPKSPRYVNGVINHRGSIIPVVDTRALLGLPTVAEQSRRLTETLSSHEREHGAWLDAIERAIRTGETPAPGPDHTACGLGRWHKQLLSDPRKMQAVTRYGQQMRSRFDEIQEPHKRLHDGVAAAIELASDGQQAEALNLIATLRAEEFEQLGAVIRRMNKAIGEGFRTMLVITEFGDRRAAFVVDAVHAVKDCAERDIDPLPDSAAGSDFLRGLVHQPDGNYILICDIERMYELACPR